MVRVNVSQISTASIPPTIKYQALAQMMDGVHRQQALHEAHELMNDCGLQAIQLMAPSPT